MTDGPTKVMVVDGHPVFAEALALAIDATGHLACVGTARDTAQALGLAEEANPDVAVMDVQFDGGEGVFGIRRLVDCRPQMHILVLTGHRLSASLVRDIAEAGACGVLPKSSSLGVVVETIPALRRPSFAIDRSSLLRLLSTSACVAGHGGTAPAALTRREQDILSLLANGIDLQTASSRLGITVNTSRGYVKSLYRKLGVHNQLELLAVARERGLIEGPR